jgi:formylglycine-generating enzyme required for sulfatase activity
MKAFRRGMLVLAALALGITLWLGVLGRWQGPTADEREITNSIGMRLVRIPAGEFLMGCEEPVDQVLRAFPVHKRTPEDFQEEYPRHRVRITRPFFLGKFEVTVGEYRQFVESTGYKTEAETDGQGGWGFNPEVHLCEGRRPHFNWRNTGYPQSDEHPVVNVTWSDSVRFCEWLTRKEGVTYRLPTEAEWEYCCRAGTTTRYHNGDDPERLPDVGRVTDPKGYSFPFPHIQKMIIPDPGPDSFTVPVGRYKPNAFGLFDMHGNVWEWCSDWQDDEYYARSPVDDPQGPEKSNVRVRRGGGWNTYPIWARASCRNFNTPVSRICNLGFRVIREIPVSESSSR